MGPITDISLQYYNFYTFNCLRAIFRTTKLDFFLVANFRQFWFSVVTLVTLKRIQKVQKKSNKKFKKIKKYKKNQKN